MNTSIATQNSSNNSTVVSPNYNCPASPGVNFVNNNNVRCCIYLSSTLGNLFCVVVFAHILLSTKKHKGYMYVYLMMNSATIAIHFGQSLLLWGYNTNVYFRHSYAIQIWYVYVERAIKFMVLQWGGMFEVAAAVDCYAAVTGKIAWFHSRSTFYIVIAVTVFIGIGIDIFKLFEYTIEPYVDEALFGDTQTRYIRRFTPFYFSPLRALLEFFHSMLRDAVVMVALIVCNFFILKSLYDMTQRRKRMEHKGNANNSSSTAVTTSSNMVTAAQRATRSKTIMMAWICINYICGHFPYLVTSIFNHNNSVFWSCFYAGSTFIMIVSYISPPFVYFTFNKHFEKTATSIVFCWRPKNRDVTTSSATATA